MESGTLFNGEITVTDTTATVVPLYGPDRKRLAINETDRVIVSDVCISPSADSTLDLFFSTSTDIPTGGKIVSVDAAAKGGINQQFANEHWGLPGESVYFKAGSAVTCRVSVRGRLISRA